MVETIKESFIRFLRGEFDVRESGREISFSCPFCGDDDGRHFSFNTVKKVGHCWKDSDHAFNMIGFIIAYKKLDYYEALAFLSGRKRISSLDSLRDKIRDIKLLAPKELKIEDTHFSVALPKKSVSLFDDIVPNEVKKWFLKRTDTLSPKLRKKVIDPYFCLDKNSKHLYRVIFKLECEGNTSYLSYNPIKYGKKTYNPPGNFNSSILGFYKFSKAFPVIILNEGFFDSVRLISYGYAAMPLFGKYISKTQLLLLDDVSPFEVCVCLDGDANKDTVKLAKKLNSFLDCRVSYILIDNKKKDPDKLSKLEFDILFSNRKTVSLVSSGVF